MERKEKGVEREGKKQEFMVKKLKRGILVGKRAGPSTPSPTWRLEFTSPNEDSKYNRNSVVQEFLNIPATAVSARKLCANLWEFQPHQVSLAKMRKGGGFKHKNKGFHLPTHVVDSPNSPPDPDQVLLFHPFFFSLFKLRGSYIFFICFSAALYFLFFFLILVVVFF